MPVDDEVVYHDAYNNSHGLYINADEIFSPRYAKTATGGDYWQYKNSEDAPLYATATNRNLEWTSDVDAPTVAGYDHTQWALGWAPGSGGAGSSGHGYITLRGYKALA